MLFMCAFMGMVVSCESPSDEPSAQVSGQIQIPQYAEDTLVTIQFTNPEIFVQSMTRADVSTVATRLDMWLTDGETTTEIHQSSTDAGFGTASVSLNKTKTYTLYAIAHRGASNATLSDGVISFPEEKVTQTFWHTTTFSPSTTTSPSTSEAVFKRISPKSMRLSTCFKAMVKGSYPTYEHCRM